jgi:hypothetical protein
MLGALVFGFTMQLADGCGSGTLYKAGASSPTSWAVLPAFIVGSFFGASHLPAWSELGGPLNVIGHAQPDAPVNLIEQVGLGPALWVTIGLCALIAFMSITVTARQRQARGESLPPIPKRWLWGAAAIALVYAAHLVVAGQPWGIVYGLGLWGAKIASAVGVDLSQDAFWGAAPHAERLLEPVLWDITSVTNIGLLYGALIADRWNLKASQKPRWPAASALLISIAAGLIMGYSSRLAFGCNVGGYLGGIASASLHGWVWFACAFLGSIVGVRARAKAGIA